jgi:hypothetical protein
MLKTEQCEQTVKAATDPTEQRIYAELARQWRQMATQAEVLEQRRADTAARLGYKRRDVGIVISRETASRSIPRTWRSRSWRKKN